MSRRGSSLLAASVLAVFLVAVGWQLPVPYVALGPGPTTDTLGSVGDDPLIVIKGREVFPTTGHLSLTTVELSSGLGLGDALKLWLDDRYAVVPRELVFPPDKSDLEVKRENTEQMVRSQQTATTAALKALNVPVTTTVVVDSLSQGSPASAVLQPGDVVTAVDGTAVSSQEQLRELVSSRTPGDSVTLAFSRAGAESTATVPTIPAPGEAPRAVIGISTREEQDYPFTVEIRLMDVGGPSAGLMFALGIYDKLTPGALTGGRFVAGTGEISDDGEVGAIGGIQQKLRAARDQGASVFLVPAANCADALRSAPDGLQLVRVDKLADALTSLDQLRDNSGTPPGCAAA